MKRIVSSLNSWRIVLIFGLVLATSCQTEPFQSQVDSEVKPWNHSQFDNQHDKFTFAVFSDLTGGERDGIFEVAIEQLNLLRPELIVNVEILERSSRSTLRKSLPVFPK
jgi:hypothetical protein